jgi:hypothetical protein
MLGMCGKRIGASGDRTGTVVVLGLEPNAGTGRRSPLGSGDRYAADIEVHRKSDLAW